VQDRLAFVLMGDTLAVERMAEEAREDLPIRLLESAAGYAPTLGILGAVLGLMRLMENLPSPAALGRGIALAFVATVYGITLANLLLLPIASRLRERAVSRGRRRDLITDALVDMHKRLNPRLVAQKARGFANVPNIADIVRQLGRDVPAQTA
jgi:chemotaxis protein MotA